MSPGFRFSFVRGAFFAGLFLFAACHFTHRSITADTSEGRGEARIVFYNVENLFDTVDDPRVHDEDFTPGGKLGWTEERLREKLDRVAEAIAATDPSLPAVVGLCEVENRIVLNRLVQSPRLVEAGYRIIHREGPDERGIDVALLYDPKRFTVEDTSWVTVRLENPEDPNTRDILHVGGRLEGERVDLFVNHWPSRSGGQEASEPYRVQLAQTLRGEIDRLNAGNSNPKVICMGDFNDHPSDRSVSKVLGAGSLRTSFLCNLMSDEEQRGEGSHWYKGEWGPLDQFIVSWSLQEALEGWKAEGSEVFRRDFLLFTDGSGQQRPNRTYAGDKYTGGYSDHLPVVLRLSRK